MAELQGRICHVVVNGRGTSKPLHGGGFLLRFAGRPCLLTAASVVRSIDDAEGSDVYFNASGAATVVRNFSINNFTQKIKCMFSKATGQDLGSNTKMNFHGVWKHPLLGLVM